MSVSNPSQAYRQVEVNTASSAQLAAMLCFGAMKFIDRAERAIRAKDVKNAHDNLLKAQSCVSELTIGLDYQGGGVIAAYLSSLYGFAERKLMEANAHKSIEALQDARTVLADLRETWRLALETANKVG